MASLNLSGQQSAVKIGTIRGIISTEDLATERELILISLLSKDSIVFSSTHPAGDGRWQLSGIRIGNYKILITGPSKIDVLKSVTIYKDSIINLGTIDLKEKYDSLSSVVVREPRLLARLKGDTVEYNTTNIDLSKNAYADELFHRLPGLQIARDGSITYN
jgi:hypothetical protein